MGQIYLTGDTHGAVPFGPHSQDGVLKRFNTENFPEQREMTKEDLVIVLGDFGLVWNREKESAQEKNALDWLEEKPFSLCFIDGNHENFDRLYALPEEEWQGGRVHVLRPSVRHLCRGQVFTLSGLSFFTFGGAACHDIQDGVLDPETDAGKIRRWRKDPSKRFRVRGYSWWPQELPAEEEREEGRLSLARAGWKVDHVLTHDLPNSIKKDLGIPAEEPNDLTAYLEEIRGKLTYRYWWGAHFHFNRRAGNHFELYEQMVRIH